MIQRIQSVYLLLVSLLILSMAFLPLINYNIGESEFVFQASGVENSINGDKLLSTLPLFALIVLISLLALITIFLYRKRKVQIKTGGAVILLLSLLVALFFFYSEEAKELIGDNVITSYKIPAFFPLIAILLMILANRAIRSDEALVRSADRIR